MKTKHIGLVLLTASILSFMPSCGDNNQSTADYQSTTEEDALELVPFNGITLYMKKSWNYKNEKDQDKMILTCSDSSFIEVHASDVGQDMSESELKESCYLTDREASGISKLPDCNIYYYTYVPKTLNGTIHVYFFSKNGYRYMIQAYQKEGPEPGIIYQNIDDILTMVRQNMVDYLNK